MYNHATYGRHSTTAASLWGCRSHGGAYSVGNSASDHNGRVPGSKDLRHGIDRGQKSTDGNRRLPDLCDDIGSRWAGSVSCTTSKQQCGSKRDHKKKFHGSLLLVR
jgi:hypothetical protein